MSETPQTPTEVDGRAALILVLCCAIWGVGLVMVKFSNAGISPFMNAALRSFVAGAILFVWALSNGVKLFKRDGTFWPGALAGFLFALEFLTLYAGLTLTQASRATIFLHCAPFVAAYGEHLFVPGHRLTRSKALGLLAAFAGLGLAFGVGGPGVSQANLAGDALCLLGGIFWGATTVVVRATPLRTAPAEKTLLYQLVVSAPIMLAVSYGFGEAGVTAATPLVLGAFAYTVIGNVVVGYTTWFWLMRTYSAASLHAFTFLTPIFGVLAGYVMLGEPLGLAVLIGLGLIACGIWLVNRTVAA